MSVCVIDDDLLVTTIHNYFDEEFKLGDHTIQLTV